MKELIKRLLFSFGYELRRVDGYYSDEDKEIIRRVSPYTMASPPRIAAVVDAVRYVSRNAIPGAIVECGVWRGGCMMAAAAVLKSAGDFRDLCLFDTFDGMTQPTHADVDLHGNAALDIFRKARKRDGGSDWCAASLDEVTTAIATTGYPMDRVHLVKGRVEDTIPGQAPAKIAVLRLDTDWYESTRHELAHLYGRLERGGVLLIDDYGYWEGARKAVDEQLPHLLLSRTDYTGRLVVKP